MTNSEIRKQTWVASGLDVVRDGTWGRLGVQRNFGETIVSGSIEGLALHEDPSSGRVFAYAGASNGGVHLRVYDPQTGWSPRWQWLSAPGSGYTGSQAIGSLALSSDRRYLAVGQGNPSNAASRAPRSEGVQLGEIQQDGSIRWLPRHDTATSKLQHQNIRSLRWQDATTLLATSWSNAERKGALLRISTDTSGIIETAAEADSQEIPSGIWQLAGLGNTNLVAGYAPKGDDEAFNQIAVATDNGAETLKGETYKKLIESLNNQKLKITRISVFPEFTGVSNERASLVAFIGSIAKQNDEHYIKRIDRLEIDASTHELLHVETYNTRTETIASPTGTTQTLYNTIGHNQAGSSWYYGNFAFAADQTDPEARRVLAGGNLFLNSSEARALTTGGGLVSIRFDKAMGTTNEYLYGPYIRNPFSPDAALVTPFSPGQPHADSRQIGFTHTADGPALILTDDGGIWQLQLNQQGQAETDAWWQSLSAPGLNTLEHNMVDWNATSNSVAGSYQDNAASIGYYGDAYATNIWLADGEIAIHDDAGRGESYTTYISQQQYLDDGRITSLTFNASGFIEASRNVDFYYKADRNGRETPLPWRTTKEAIEQKTRFIRPIEANAYRRGSIVMAGHHNAYESVQINPPGLPNTIVFTPLLEADVREMDFTAIDHQGSADQGPISSIYLTGVQKSLNQATPTRTLLYGRQSNDQGEHRLTLLLDSSEPPPEGSTTRLRNLPIVDLAHMPTESGKDRVFILQGGIPLLYSAPTSNNEDPHLLIREPDGRLIAINLQEKGITLDPRDPYGLQSLVYVPEKPGVHDALLVLGGLSGQWMSSLAENGEPTGFTSMPWQSLTDSTHTDAPGVPLMMTKYDPDDDLLICGTLGKGSWLYSFSGDLGERPAASTLLQVPDTRLIQRRKADLDKRNNEENQTLYIQLDGRLRNNQTPIDVTITLHDAAAWRKYMEVVSPFTIPLQDDLPTSAETAYAKAAEHLNILRTEGLNHIGATERGGNIEMPFTFNPGVNIYGLTINAQELESLLPDIRLDYSVSTSDGQESVRRTLTLHSDPDDFATVHGASLQAGTNGESPLSVHPINSIKPEQQEQIQRHNRELKISTSPLIYDWDLKPDDAAANPAVLSIPFAGQDIPPAADPTGDYATFAQVIYERDASNAITGARTFGFDNITGQGFRFYDLNGDGEADRFTLSGPPADAGFFNPDWISPTRLAVAPSLVPESAIQLSVADRHQSHGIALRLAGSLVQRASRVSEIGYLVLDPGQTLTELSDQQFRDRARTLFSSLGPSIDTLPTDSRFQREILISNGQSLLLFQVKSGTIDQLTHHRDPRLLWFELKPQLTPQRAELGTADGTQLALELQSGVQGGDALIGVLQDQAPLLDFRALSPENTITANLAMGREGVLNTICGFYTVQNSDGTVKASDGRLLKPGDADYRQEALRPDNLVTGLSTLQAPNRKTLEHTATLRGGVILAPFATVRDNHYFCFASASSDGRNHFQLLGNNLIGLEDLPGLGDQDFNDVVMNFRFAIS